MREPLEDEVAHRAKLGDALRAMVVCRRGKKSGDLIYRTWKQLEQAFDIREGHGRLKNNYATAGMPNDDPKVFAKNQKPPDIFQRITAFFSPAKSEENKTLIEPQEGTMRSSTPSPSRSAMAGWVAVVTHERSATAEPRP